MTVLTVETTMLYCPKCQQTYEDGVQRFCLKDGGRLLRAASSGKSVNPTGGVFTKVINLKNREQADEFATAPKFSEVAFRPPAGKIFKSEAELEAESDGKSETEIRRLPLIKIQTEINFEPSAAEVTPHVGNRQINSAHQSAVMRENSTVFAGKIVKDRFRIMKKIGADEDAIDFLAEDETSAGKKVVVRVLSGDETKDSFADKIFGAELLALSHVAHPNVAAVFDAGELSEGKSFVVTEFIEGKSVKDYLQGTESLTVLQIARAVRQASYALSEIHQNGVLHRNLKPEHLVLTVNETGAEQVKLINFGTAAGKLHEKNLPYKAPEQVEGKLANFASDEFALAVIAYEMLTGRLPFEATRIGDLLKQQREGLSVPASRLRSDLSPSVDAILEKALAFNAADRFPKARDFGDALFNAVSVGKSAARAESDSYEPAATVAETVILAPVSPLPANVQTTAPTVDQNDLKTKTVKATEDLAREKRSPELASEPNARRALFAFLGLLIIIGGLFVIWHYFINRADNADFSASTPLENVVAQESANENSTVANFHLNPSPPSPPEEIESAPLPRTISPPPDTVYFQNNKENLQGEAAKNFLGFSLYYPNDWKRNEAKNNFLDVSKTSGNGFPVEQMLVSFYDSRGTYRLDKENFAKIVEKSNNDLRKALQGNYKIISQGETKIQNGRWQAFEVKFESSGTARGGEKIALWGRRLWIPAQIAGLKNGYVITMLATSLAGDIRSVEDVGVRGELSDVLETFEPLPNF